MIDPDETIIDPDGSPIPHQLTQGMFQGGASGLVGSLTGLMSNPQEFNRLTTMDKSRKADLEALAIGLGTYGIGKVAPGLPPALKGLAAGVGVQWFEGFLKRR